MIKNAGLGFVLLMMVGCATGGSGDGGKSNYDTRAQLMVNSKPAPLDDTLLEGVWNDWSDSAIALVHKEGEEYRILVAVGDTRPNIPLTTFEATNMGNPLPDDNARARATEALKSWKNGVPTSKDRFLFALVGTKSGEGVSGSWSDGNGECGTDRWGNFYFSLKQDKNGAPVIYMSVYATAKKLGGGLGGQTFEFGRFIYFGKAKNPIPPSMLEKLQATDNFCRRTAN